MESAQRFPIETQASVEQVRRAARAYAASLGFGVTDTECVVLSVIELASNLLRHALQGELMLTAASSGTGAGLRIESSDCGPGIADLEAALCDGCSTAGGLGSGLAAVDRLMDQMEITSKPTGTSIVAYKWLPIR